MALPQATKELPNEVAAVDAELADIDTAIAALPATPVEADLPDIVNIVVAIKAASTNLNSIMNTIVTVLSTTRINQ